jgi:hypothetical protein
MNIAPVGLFAITLVAPALMAVSGDLASCQNLAQFTVGQAIEVTKANGESLRGTFASFVDQSITLRGKQQETAIPRSDVSRVRLRSPGDRRWMWIGMAAGAGAGLGALVGVVTGSIIDSRRTTLCGRK